MGGFSFVRLLVITDNSYFFKMVKILQSESQVWVVYAEALVWFTERALRVTSLPIDGHLLRSMSDRFLILLILL